MVNPATENPKEETKDDPLLGKLEPNLLKPDSDSELIQTKQTPLIVPRPIRRARLLSTNSAFTTKNDPTPKEPIELSKEDRTRYQAEARLLIAQTDVEEALKRGEHPSDSLICELQEAI
jgi:hypothetical protein